MLTRRDFLKVSAGAAAFVAAGPVIAKAGVAATEHGFVRVDDTAMIQALIDEAHLTGKPAIVPPGVYSITRTLSVSDNVTLRGYGSAFSADFEDEYLPLMQITGDNIVLEGISIQNAPGPALDVSSPAWLPPPTSPYV